MSQAEELIGWQPPKTVRLRSGQQKLLEKLLSTVKNEYAVKLPTGYGKSWCACIGYAVTKFQGRADRMLIVVPTDQQRSQYIDGLREDLAILGIQYLGIERCDNQSSWVIKKSYQNSSDIFIATAPSIKSSPSYYSDLMSKGNWLVVADEFHHYAEDNTWGKAVADLPYDVLLGMSATPLRRDSSATIFSKFSFDVEVELTDAFEEGAVKKIEGRIGDYSVSWSSIDDPVPHNCLTSELAEELQNSGVSNFSEFEIKKGIRYYDKYISEIFLQVLEAWCDYERQWPGQNQILVFAMSCRHAELVTKIINECAFPGFPAPFADWIGVGDSADSPKSDQENRKTLDLFQGNKLPCLVQVNKAGEGFNNKRCSIGLFLDLIGPTPMKIQHIGRFMRVNSKAEGQSSLIFISSDSPCRDLLEGIEQEFTPPGEKEEPGEGNESEERDIRIPDLMILDTRFESERRVYPFGDGSPEAMMNHILETQASPEIQAIAETMGEEQLAEFFIKHTKALVPQQKPPTSEEKRQFVQRQVKQNTGRLVSNILRKRYGKTWPKTAMGDMYRLINSRWKRQHSAHDEMTEQDLHEKNKWLQQIAQQVNEGGIPTWLSL